MKYGYISAHKLESERSKSFAVSILLQTKDFGGQFRVPGTGKYPPSSGKFNRSWSKSRRAYGGLGYSFILKVNWGYISAQKLESESSKKFCWVHFSANQGHQELVYTPRDWKISPKFGEIEPNFVKITMRVRQSRLLFHS